MSQYRVKMIIEGRSTYVVVSAYSAAEAASLARAQVCGQQRSRAGNQQDSMTSPGSDGVHIGAVWHFQFDWGNSET